MSVNSKMTALADEIRELSGTITAKSIDAMTADVNAANTEVNEQADLIAQIKGVVDSLPEAGGGTGGENTELVNSLISRTITSYSDDRLTTIGGHAFTGCRDLTSVSLPACTGIGTWAFSACTNLMEVSFPACMSIGTYAFAGCTNLTNINFPVCTSVGANAFTGCDNLTGVVLPTCVNLGDYAFNDCIKLTSVNAPICASIGSNAFYGCSGLMSVNFPVCTSIGSGAFRSCAGLTNATFGSDIPIINTSIKAFICTDAFRGCSKLINLTLYYPSVAALSNTSAFYSTPMSVSTLTGTFGSIYVPGSLVNKYKSATNWVTYADRITAIPGTEEEATTISFTLDGTQYSAEAGMTFKEWTWSDYNVDGWSVSGLGDSASIYTPNGDYYEGDLTPSTVLEDGAVYGDPTISFTLDGTQYSAEAGMTFGDWIGSTYNVDGWQKDLMGTGLARPSVPMPYGVSLTTVIEAGGVY